MNRKGKKSPLTRVKNTKANRKKHGSLNLNANKATAKKAGKSKPKRNKIKAIADSNPRLKQSLIAKQNAAFLPRSPKSHQKAKKPLTSLWLAIYIVTIAIGLSTILGTIVSVASTNAASGETTPPTTITSNSPNKAKLDSLFTIASLGKEIVPLKSSLQQLVAEYPELDPEVFLIDLDTKGFVSIKGEEVIT